MTKLAALPDRAVLAVTGDDRVAFLQGLVSNDVAEAQPGRAVWAALLTPQGKWLADFFINSDGERLLLDCEAAQLPMLSQRLSRYRLRSRVSLGDAGLGVYVAWDGDPRTELRGGEPAGLTGGHPDGRVGGLIARDPRLPDAGWRILAAEPPPSNATATDWDLHRLTLGLPDGSRDMEPEKSVLLEAGFDELNGISWTKGCYMGQELTARTKYRGLVKRRLVPVRIDGATPAPGSPLLRDGREVGTMRSASRHEALTNEDLTHEGMAHRGMALVRLEALESALSSGDATVTPMVPGWMRPGSD
jgi:folate-binding protein YgfZ